MSGYLIGNQVFGEYRKNQALRLKRFYTRRFLRTLPNYYFVLLLYILLPWFHEQSHMAPLWKFLTFTMNIGLDGGTFSHAWSLCIEEQFYFVLPFIVLLILAIKKRVGVILPASLIAFGLCLRYWISQTYIKGSGDYYWLDIYYPTWCRLDSLIFGVSLAGLKNFKPQLWSKFIRHGNIHLLAGTVCLTIALFLFADRFSTSAIVFGFPLLGLGFSLWLLSALSEQGWIHHVKIPGAKWLALLAYAVYLIHKQMIHLTETAFDYYGCAEHGWILAIVSAALSLLFAYAIYLLIERPCLALRDRVAP